VQIVGAHATPARPVAPGETERILAGIREAGPDVVWVGMGTPAQDVWMAGVVARAALPMVGVGSLFDLLAGLTRPAPAWMKRAGLQWLFRLLQEPRRLAARYLYYNARFAVALCRQLAGVARPR
jgi:N-acetylglucosaminyldiphosphoundecaprenol N-acetyl-beta-D-mannosaminyltransferase